MSKGTIQTSVGDLTRFRLEVIEEFNCPRCHKDVKSKNRASWDKLDGTNDIICNGCYGEILSKEPNR